MVELTVGYVPPDPKLKTLEEKNKEYILYVFALLGGNSLRTARTLQISRATLYRRLHAYGVFDVPKVTDDHT